MACRVGAVRSTDQSEDRRVLRIEHEAYAEAYAQFEEENKGKTIVEAKTADLVGDMAHALLNDCGSTSVQVCKLLKWGKPEVSHFVEYEGCKFKYRPDLETKRNIVDWKTVATDDLSEENINRIILKFGYHISAAFYLFMEHERTGIWKLFILVLVSKVAPYDCVMVDMNNYGYRYLPEYDMVIPGPGALEFKKTPRPAYQMHERKPLARCRDIHPRQQRREDA